MGKQSKQTVTKQDSVEYREGMPVQAQLDVAVQEAQRLDSMRRAEEQAESASKAFMKDDDDVVEAGKEKKMHEVDDLEAYASAGSTIVPNENRSQAQSEDEPAQTEIKKSSRRKLLCLLLPLAAVATTAITAVTVATTLP